MDLEKALESVIDKEAEMGVIGSILTNGEYIRQVSELLNPEDFSFEVNQKIYSVMLIMEDKGINIDSLTLTQEIKKKKIVVDNLSPYLAECMSIVPYAGNIVNYANTVKEKKTIRELISASNEIIVDAGNAVDIEEVIDKAEQKIFSLAKRSNKKRTAKIKDYLDKGVEKIELLRSGNVADGIPTGITELDAILNGLHNSDLIIIGARPSRGKSSLAITIANEVSKAYPVALFSLEMSGEQVSDRVLSLDSKVNLWKIRTGKLMSDEDMKSVKESATRLNDRTFFIDDSASISIMDIRRACRRIKSENKDLALIIVDYLQLIKSRHDNPVHATSEISRGLKMIAKELNVPVIALSQLSRSIEQRDDSRPKLSDLRDSGSIEQDADIVIFIHTAHYYGDETKEGLTELIVAKHRNGPVGTAECVFNKELAAFQNK